MSKTIAEIGLIVGGLALALVAGPVGIIALEGNVAVFNAMVGIGLVTALSGVGLALRQTPQIVGTANSISFTNGVSPRRVIYGQFQTAGVLTYASFPPSQNQNVDSQFLHLVYTLTGHEIQSFDAVVIDGMIYNFVSDLNYPGGADTTWHVDPGPTALKDFYWQHMFLEFDYGRPGDYGQPFPNLAAADSSWTGACRQQGCAKVHVVLRADAAFPNVYPSGQIPNIQFLVTGKKIADPRVVTAWLASTVYARYRYVIDGNGYIWVLVGSGGTSGATRPNFEANDGFGNTLTDNTCTWQCCWVANGPGISTTAVAWNNRLVNDGWETTSGFNQYVVIESPVGYYQMCTTNAVVGGAAHPDFATTLGAVTPDGSQSWVCLGRSPNAANLSNNALVVADYLEDTDYGMGAPAATIDNDSVIAAANVCEEQVLIIWNPDGSVVYENLYACNGMFDHSSERGNVLTALCSSMAGWVVPPGDFWHVFAGAYMTATVTLSDDDLRAPIKGDFRLSKRDVANGVKGTFVPAYLPANPAAALSMSRAPGTWQSQSFPAYQANGMAGKPNYLNSEDGGQIIWQDLRLDFTTSLWMAQRLAKITLMRLRFQETLTLPCKLTALGLSAGDTFYFTHKRWSMTFAFFEITQCSITFDTSSKDSVPVAGIDLVARQTDASIYEFTPPSSPSDYGEYSPYGVTGVMTGVE